jgi:hypothetical protein
MLTICKHFNQQIKFFDFVCFLFSALVAKIVTPEIILIWNCLRFSTFYTHLTGVIMILKRHDFISRIISIFPRGTLINNIFYLLFNLFMTINYGILLPIVWDKLLKIAKLKHWLTVCTIFSCEMATCCQWNSRQ